MSQSRELNIKPSCATELLSVPPAQTAQIWEKIHLLLDNPLADGKLKKKLKAKDDLYRLRAGDFRIFYTFGDEWIRLIAVRRRDSQTYGNKAASLAADAPVALPADDDDLDVDALDGPPRMPFRFSAKPAAAPVTKTALPRPIDAAWLQQLRIPPAHMPALLLCKTEEELLAADVPEPVLQRVLDAFYPRSVEEVLKQPDLAVQSPADLVRFKEGTLLGFLLRLDAEQAKLTTWALKGPTLVRGGAGTGKSTVALYRVRELLRQPRSTGKETALFTTYTRALQNASRQLLEQLLQPDELARVRVATCDELARQIVEAGRKVGPLDFESLHHLREALKTFEPDAPSAIERKLRKEALLRIGERYLLDEFDWIIEGRGVSTFVEYEKMQRTGRGIPIGPKLRQAVWALYNAWRERIKATGRETFMALRREAGALAEAGKTSLQFDYVLVDEAQDLPPVALRFIAHLARTPQGLFFAADTKQSIYARGSGWSGADPRLQFTGRTAVLKRNYRSTAEIDLAAFDLLRPEPEDALEASTSPHAGPPPVLLRKVPPQKEGFWAAQFLRQMAQYLRIQTHAAAVLVPDNATAAELAKAITAAGVPARFFEGKHLDLRVPEVKVITFHAAKGLEFPTVVVGGLHPASYPIEEEYADPEEYQEELRHHRRLLYVACTRAMRGLMLIQTTASDDPALADLDTKRWNVQESA